MKFEAKEIRKKLIDTIDNIIVDLKQEYLIYNNVYEEVKQISISSTDESVLPYIIKDEKDILFVIINYYSKILKNKNNVFLLSALFILFLTNFNPKALDLINDFLDNFEYNREEIQAFIESSDTRGLLFYLCKVYKLDYDKLNEYVEYVYFEPKVNKKWMNKFHKKGRPIVFWFYRNYIGKGLFVVLYTPKCRYKLEKGGCAGCNLPTLSASQKFASKEDIVNQIDYIFENISKGEKRNLNEIIMSNNGSILDFNTMDYEALKYFIKKSIEEIPSLKQIVFETRIDYYSDFSKMKELLKYKNELRSNVTYEIAIGFEIFDDVLRNDYYKKGINKDILEKNIAKLQNLDINLRIYMMFKPVPDQYMNINKAIEDINKAAQYFSNLNKKYNIGFILHITPTYLAYGTKLYQDYKKGLYTPVKLEDVELLYENLNIYPNIKYYISLNNEGLGEDYFKREEYQKFLKFKKEINRFNIKQNK